MPGWLYRSQKGTAPSSSKYTAKRKLTNTPPVLNSALPKFAP